MCFKVSPKRTRELYYAWKADAAPSAKIDVDGGQIEPNVVMPQKATGFSCKEISNDIYYTTTLRTTKKTK